MHLAGRSADPGAARTENSTGRTMAHAEIRAKRRGGVGPSYRVVTWQEALDFIAGMSRDMAFGFSDWRLPNINELESPVNCGMHSPAWPADHPFKDLRGGYWSSTMKLKFYMIKSFRIF